MALRDLFVAGALTAALAMSGPGAVARSAPSELTCQQDLSALTAVRAGLAFPPAFSHENPRKQGGEFDPNRYFGALTDLTMKDGFTLDYVYHQDGMGGYPILYARPVDQAPYPDEAAFKSAGEHPDYLRFIEPRDTPAGYFQYALFAMMANQFYLDWHAHYNDWTVVCGLDGIEGILRSLDVDTSSGRPMSTLQKQQARAIHDPLPSVTLTDRSANVAMLVFTKWGGFYRRTLVIDRQDHSITDDQNTPLVEYDCGIAF